MQFVAHRLARSHSVLLPKGKIFSASRPALFLPARTIFTKKYTNQHECVIFDDSTGIGVITLTNHAQSSLGDVVFVELPSVGSKVKQGDQIGAVESVKAASDIYAPVSGEVKEINEKLDSEPGLLNKSPEDQGWLCKIELANPSEVDSLMTEKAYEDFCEAKTSS